MLQRGAGAQGTGRPRCAQRAGLRVTHRVTPYLTPPAGHPASLGPLQCMTRRFGLTKYPTALRAHGEQRVRQGVSIPLLLLLELVIMFQIEVRRGERCLTAMLTTSFLLLSLPGSLQRLYPCGGVWERGRCYSDRSCVERQERAPLPAPLSLSLSPPHAPPPGRSAQVRGPRANGAGGVGQRCGHCGPAGGGKASLPPPRWCPGWSPGRSCECRVRAAGGALFPGAGVVATSGGRRPFSSSPSLMRRVLCAPLGSLCLRESLCSPKLPQDMHRPGFG